MAEKYTTFTNVRVTGELTVQAGSGDGAGIIPTVKLTGAPTTATAAPVPSFGFYSGVLYLCTAKSGSTYTWKSVSLTAL